MATPQVNFRFSGRTLKAMILPLFLEQLLLLLVGMADTLVVSYAGEAAVSGVSLVNQFNTVFLYLFTALAAGGGVLFQKAAAADGTALHPVESFDSGAYAGISAVLFPGAADRAPCHLARDYSQRIQRPDIPLFRSFGKRPAGHRRREIYNARRHCLHDRRSVYPVLSVWRDPSDGRHRDRAGHVHGLAAAGNHLLRAAKVREVESISGDIMRGKEWCET